MRGRNPNYGTNGGNATPALAPIFQNNNSRGGAGANNNNNGGVAEGTAAATLETDLEGDKGVRRFWKHGHECIFDIGITNTESRSHRNKDPTKCLASQEKDKKGKDEEACHEERKDFTPLVSSIDGMVG